MLKTSVTLENHYVIVVNNSKNRNSNNKFKIRTFT